MLLPLAATLLAVAAAAAPEQALPRGDVPASAATAARPLLVFRGNVILVDEVFENLLALPPDSAATPALAAEVAGRLERFLRSAGYELASVHARAEGGQLVVDVDEGRIDRIVFFGSSLVGTQLLRLQLILPFNVFNRPLLMRRLQALRGQYGVLGARWELVATAKRDDSLPFDALEQLRQSAVALAEQSDLVAPQAGFELRIYIEQAESSGFSPVVGVGSGNGIELGSAWHGPSLFAAGDHLETEARVAGNTRSRLDDNSREIFLSHVGLVGRWLSPPIGGSKRLHAYLEAGGDLIQRQRQDLALNSFLFTTVDLSLNLRANLPLGIDVHGGVGVERRWLSQLEPATATTPLLPEVDGTQRAQTRWLLALGGEAVLRPFELRESHRHLLETNLTLFARPNQPQPAQATVEAQYQRVLSFGYHELWLQARGWLLFGEVPFPDERQVSDVTRGPFGSIYTRAVAGPRVEFRFALLRDVLQFGIYDDAAAYGAINRVTSDSSLQFAEVGGLAFHALLLDSLQLDVYLGMGLSTQGQLDTGLSLQLQQAF